MSTPAAPSVFAYLDYRRFLRDWMEWKREISPSYTFGVFAQQAKLSRAVLPNVIDGRREPSEATLDGFARAMRLDEDELSFLSTLVALKRASSLDENADLLRKLFNHPRYAGGQVVDTRHLEAMSSWVRMALVELARLPGVVLEPSWLAARLRPEVPEEEIAKALEVLQAEGLVPGPDGQGQGPHRLFTPPDFDNISAHRLHQSALDAAKDALQQVPWDERTFGMICSSVPRAAVPDVLAEVQAFVERIRELCDGYGDESDSVMQLNVQAWLLATPEDEGEDG